MKTITIPAQESAAALASALANALATEIGWTADEDGNIKKTDSSLYFRCYSSSSSVNLSVSNGYTTASGGSTTPYTSNQDYKLWVIKTAADSIAVGVGKSNDVPKLGAMIVRNISGEYVGFAFASNTIYTLYKGESAARTLSLGTNTNDGISTGIVKMLDIWNGTKFADLYYVMSCPFKSTDLVFFIDGKYYRSIGANANYMYFALPDG